MEGPNLNFPYFSFKVYVSIHNDQKFRNSHPVPYAPNPLLDSSPKLHAKLYHLTLSRGQHGPTCGSSHLGPSNRRILIHETDVSGSLRVPPHKILVPWRPLILGVSCQHALDTHAHTCDILHRAPSLRAEQVQADDAVGVDVWVDGDGAVGGCHEGYFGSFCKGGDETLE